MRKEVSKEMRLPQALPMTATHVCVSVISHCVCMCMHSEVALVWYQKHQRCLMVYEHEVLRLHHSCLAAESLCLCRAIITLTLPHPPGLLCLSLLPPAALPSSHQTHAPSRQPKIGITVVTVVRHNQRSYCTFNQTMIDELRMPVLRTLDHEEGFMIVGPVSAAPAVYRAHYARDSRRKNGGNRWRYRLYWREFITANAVQFGECERRGCDWLSCGANQQEDVPWITTRWFDVHLTPHTT